MGDKMFLYNIQSEANSIVQAATDKIKKLESNHVQSEAYLHIAIELLTEHAFALYMDQCNKWDEDNGY